MCLPNAERRTTEAKPVEICRSDNWADTWVRPYNREVTALPKLKFLYLFIALKSEGFIPVFALNFEEK